VSKLKELIELRDIIRRKIEDYEAKKEALESTLTNVCYDIESIEEQA